VDFIPQYKKIATTLLTFFYKNDLLCRIRTTFKIFETNIKAIRDLFSYSKDVFLSRDAMLAKNFYKGKQNSPLKRSLIFSRSRMRW